MISALEAYKMDHQGQFPLGGWYKSDGSSSNWEYNFSNYTNKLSQIYNIEVFDLGTSTWTAMGSARDINVIPGRVCPGDARTPTSDNAAVEVGLVGNGDANYCQSL